MTELSDRIHALDERRRVLLNLLHGKGAESLDIPRVVRSGQRVPLSFGQERLWFLNRLEPENPSYNEAFGISIEGRMDPNILASCLGRLVARHDILRTRFGEENGRPYQLAPPRNAAPTPFPVQMDDLSRIAEGAKQEELKVRMVKEARRPFDLLWGPLLRAVFYLLGPDESALLITVHHIACDAWSMRILVREFCDLWLAALNHGTVELSPLPISYADYALWQRRSDKEAWIRKLCREWADRLGGDTIPLLPTDHVRPSESRHRGRRISWMLSSDLWQCVKAFSQAEEVTPFTSLLTGFQLLLHKYSGEDKICVGIPEAGRAERELEGLVGFLANTLVIPLSFAGPVTIRDAMMRAREACTWAFDMREVPFEKVVEAAAPLRTLSHAPLFQAMFAFYGDVEGEIRLPDAKLRPIDLDIGVAKYDLLLSAVDTNGSLKVGLEFDVDLFELETAQLLLRNYQRTLEFLVRDSETRVDELDLRERTELASPIVASPSAANVLELFRDSVARDNGASALVFGTEALEYGELDAMSDAVASALQRVGVTSGSPVVTLIDRSPSLIVGMLGILKAGSACVPLNAADPRQRLQRLMRGAGTAAILTDHQLGEPFGPWPIVDVRHIDPSALNPRPLETHIEECAYVVYTSGSTGVPKAVAMPHAALANLVNWQIARSECGVGSRTLQFSTPWFDVFFQELFATLGAGGCLVLISEEDRSNPEQLIRILREYRVNRLFLPFVALQMLAAEADAHGIYPDSLQEVVTAGEQLKVTPEIRSLFQATPGTVLENQYGPSETHVVTAFRLQEDPARWERLPPIGVAIDNVRLRVVDSELREVPTGAVGELCVGGVALARGYANARGQTALSFVPDPEAVEAGSRLYRTGDLVRRRPDGGLEFRGRCDTQVKVRGYRVEPGEVEAALLESPDIREAVVVSRSLGTGGPQLFAFVVLIRGSGLTPKAIRAFLAELLPDYSVPSQVAVVESLPHTTSGKIDRLALVPRATVEPLPDEAPSDDVENALVKVWAEVLGVERVGIHSNFFDLGGDSITSLQVLAKARERGLHITTKDVFRFPTVKQLAEVARTRPASTPSDEPTQGRAALSPAQAWFFDRIQHDRSHWNMSVLLEVRRPVSAQMLRAAVDRVVRHHNAFRTRFELSGGRWIQTFDEGGALPPLEILELPAGSIESRRQMIEEVASDRHKGLDIENGPIADFVYFDFGGEACNRLLLLVHHLVFDFVSMRIVLEDLESALFQLAESDEVRLSAKTSSFLFWSRKLVESALRGDWDEQKMLWREQERSAMHLPLDRPGGENFASSERYVELYLSAAETDHLTLLSGLEGTLVLILSAAASALWKWTGESRVQIYLEGHGRSSSVLDLDVSRTVGWFTAFYPLALDLPGEFGLERIVLEVGSALARVPDGGLGYGVLRYLCGMRARSSPTMPVVVNYLGRFDAELSRSSWFSPMRQDPRLRTSPRSERPFELNIVAAVIGGRLQTRFWYSEGLHNQTTIEELAADYQNDMEELLRNRKDRAGDYHKAGLTRADLAKIAARVRKRQRQEKK